MESDLIRDQRGSPGRGRAGREFGPPDPDRALRRARNRAGLAGLGLGVVIAWGLAIRLISLDTIPPNVAEYEANGLRDVFRILAGRGAPGLFGLDWAGSPAFGVYLTAAFVNVFGPSIASTRYASAVSSSLALVPLYFLARERLSVKASLIACFLTSVSLPFLHSSRDGWHLTYVSLFSLTAAWCLVNALRGRGPYQGRMLFGLSGVSAALAAYSDLSGFLSVVSLLVFLPFALFDYRRNAKRVLAGYLLLLVSAAVVVTPQLPAVVTHWEEYSHSAGAVSTMPAEPASPAAKSTVGTATSRLGRMLTGFVLLDGRAIDDARFSPAGRPILDPVSGSLFVIGLAAALFRFRRRALWLSLFAVPLGGMLLLPTRLPVFSIAIPLVPVMCLLAGLGFDAIGARGGARTKVIQLAAIVLLPWAAYDNLSDYVAWSATPEMAAARYPAVETAEFATWRKLQTEAAARGEPGFSVEEWQLIRSKYADSSQPPPAGTRPQSQSDASRSGGTGPTRAEAQPAPRLLIPDPAFQADLFAQPRGVAFAPDGGLYVADAAAHEVVRLDPKGKVLYRLGGEGADDGHFLEPWDVAVDSTGRLYVLDSQQESIQRFSPNGEFEARLLANEGLYRPRGVAFGDDGLIYVADTGRNRVLKADRAGRLVAVIGEVEGGVKLDQPTDVAVDASGAIWIVEPSAKRLERFDAAGRRVGVWDYPAANTLNAPHLAIAGDWLLGTDPAQHRLMAINLATASVVRWQPADEGGFQLVQPFAVAADRNGAVVVSDSQTGSVLRFRLGSAD